MFTIQFSNCTLRHVVQKNENLRLTKKTNKQTNLYINVYGSFIHNNPKLKTAQKSFNKSRVKQAMVTIHPSPEQHSAIKEIDTCKTWMISVE